MPVQLRLLASLLCGLLLLQQPLIAFDTPLSDTAIREAYFLGQRHDLRSLEPYTKVLPVPKKGPHIAQVTFLTPFAQLVEQTITRVGSYSAQQAEIDHRGVKESVKLTVLINLTSSYSTIILPGDPSNPSGKPIPRPYDFWKDIKVTVLDGGEPRESSEFHGRYNSSCAKRGPCVLTGATLELTFRAESFLSDTVVIRVIPPESDPVVVEFSLNSLR